jgi:transcription factor Dp-1
MEPDHRILGVSHMPDLMEVLWQEGVSPADLTEADDAVMRCLRAAEEAVAGASAADDAIAAWQARLGGVPPSSFDSGEDLQRLQHQQQQQELEERQHHQQEVDPDSNADADADAGPKRKRNAATAAAAAAAAAPAAGALVSAPPLDPASPVPSKGLRRFSLKVCAKVEGRGRTNYNEVADDLVADLRADAASGAGDASFDEKNVRRRVYDALNVLTAVGMITKDRKEIEWRGWPPGLGVGAGAADRLRTELRAATTRLSDKARRLSEAAAKGFCVGNLVLRNCDAPLPLLAAAHEAGLGAPNPLALPFMLVTAPPGSSVDVTMEENRMVAHLDFGG